MCCTIDTTYILCIYNLYGKYTIYGFTHYSLLCKKLHAFELNFLAWFCMPQNLSVPPLPGSAPVVPSNYSVYLANYWCSICLPDLLLHL